MRVVANRDDPLTGYVGWALDLLSELNVVRDGLIDGTMSNRRALRQIDEVIDSKHGPPRYYITIVNTNEPPGPKEPPDPTELELNDYARMLAAFLGGIRGHPGSLRWLGSFLEQSSHNQTLTVVGYLRALIPDQPNADGIPSQSEVRLWIQRLGSGGLSLKNRGREILTRYKLLADRHK